MLANLKARLAPPVFADEEKTRAAGLLHILLLAMLAITVLYTSAAPLTHDTPGPLLLTGAILIPTWLAGLILLRRGYVRPTALAFCGMLWILFALVLVGSGGITAAASTNLVTVVIVASLLLGVRAGVVVAALSILLPLGLMLTDRTALTVPAALPSTPLSSWVTLSGNIAVAVLILHLANRSIHQALDRTRVTGQALAEANRGLLREIAERQETESALERSAALLRATIDSTAEAIIVIDRDREIIASNRQLLELWDLPDDWPDIPDAEQRYQAMVERVQDPAAFIARGQALLDDLSTPALDEIALLDGRFLERRARPYRVGGEVIGRLYAYLDITGRRQDEQQLAFLSEFQALVTTLATQFINLPSEELDDGVRRAIQRIGAFIGADVCAIGLQSVDDTALDYAFEWKAPGIRSLADWWRRVSPSDLPWLFERLARFETVYIPHVADLPPAAAADRAALAAIDVQSMIALPLHYQDHLLGLMGFGTMQTARLWSEDVVGLLHIAGEMFVNALERRRTERVMIESELSFHTIFDQAPLGVAVIDPDNRFLAVNQTLGRMFGYEAAELVGRTLVELAHPDEVSAVAHYVGRLRDGAAVSGTVINRYRTKDGEIIWATVTPCLVDADPPYGIAMIADITERKQAEDALLYYSDFQALVTSLSTEFINLASDEIDRAIIYALRTITEFVGADISRIMLLNEDRTIGSCTHEWCMPGVEPMQHLLQSIPIAGFPWLMAQLERFQPVQIPRVADLPEEAAAERDFLLALQARSAVMMPLVFGGTLLGFVSHNMIWGEQVWSDDLVALLRIAGEIFANALERRRTEAVLAETEARFGQFAEGVDEVFILTDRTVEQVYYVNPAFEAMFGHSVEALKAHPGRVFKQLVHPEDWERMLQAPYREEITGGHSYHTEYRIIRPDGEQRWISADITPILDEQGKVYRLAGISTDITDQKLAEERRLALALEREKTEILRTLIGNVSHDLKTPLSVINTNLYLLERLNDSDQGQARLDIIKLQTARLEKLIQDLLTISRLDYLPELTVAPVDLAALLGTIGDQLRSAVEQKNLAATFDVPPDLPPVLADADELHRVFVNLVENAIKYTPRGRSITVSAAAQAGSLVVEVRDTGIGIEAADLPHIFERFYRAASARDSDASGSGLGLAIVRKVIDMHRGSVEVESMPGQGTSFRVRLPAAGGRHVEDQRPAAVV